MRPLPRREPTNDERIEAEATPAGFSRVHFNWSPYPYQEEVMDAILAKGKRRIAWVAGRRVGKTETIANIALQLAVKRKGIKIAIFAPTQRQSRILANRIKYMLAGSRWAKHVTRDNLTELRLGFGEDEHGKPIESVIFANSMTGQVRGEGADVLIVDESAFCKPEDYRNKALPFVADRPDAIIIHISTVWSEDDHFTEALKLYATLPDGATFRTPSSMKPGVTEQKLAELRKSMLESEYLREYECELVPNGGVFPKKGLGDCFHEYHPADIRTYREFRTDRQKVYLMGVDWGKKQDRAVIAVVEQGQGRGENPARLVFLQIYEPDPENSTHYTTILEHIKEVAKHFSARRVVVDEGEGAHQVEVLKRHLGGRLISFRFGGKSRNHLVDNARWLVEKRMLQLPEEPSDVKRAFLNVQRTDLGYEHATRKHKDVFDAIALALSETGLGEPKRSMRVYTIERPLSLRM
ncbi:MAG: AAA family ATPase [Halobacteriales archaeon]|nr:AAA family ATPase [Halobacteriales archaeon]